MERKKKKNIHSIQKSSALRKLVKREISSALIEKTRDKNKQKNTKKALPKTSTKKVVRYGIGSPASERSFPQPKNFRQTLKRCFLLLTQAMRKIPR